MADAVQPSFIAALTPQRHLDVRSAAASETHNPDPQIRLFSLQQGYDKVSCSSVALASRHGGIPATCEWAFCRAPRSAWRSLV